MRIIITLLVLLSAASANAASSCTASVDTRRFIEASIRDWTALSETLGLRTPVVSAFFFDSACLHRTTIGAASGLQLTSTTHEGTLALPDGTGVSARLMTFASSSGDSPFIVVALPELWESSERHRDHPNLELLIESVFMHEMMHTVHTPLVGSLLDEVERRHPGLPIDDDIVQKTFESDPQFVTAYERERDLLFAAAVATDRREASRKIEAARRSMLRRREAHFTGKQRMFVQLEDIFLAMEGAGQLAGHLHSLGRTSSEEKSIELIRGGRRWWSQDLGFAIAMVVRRFDSDWKKHLLTSKPLPIPDLLTIASRGARR